MLHVQCIYRTDCCKMEDITWKKVPLFTDCACTLICLSLLVVLPILLDLTSLFCSGLFERLNSNGLYTSKYSVTEKPLTSYMFIRLNNMYFVLG